MKGLVEKYYKQGLYTNDNMKVFVKACYITADDYKTITGEDYVAPTA